MLQQAIIENAGIALGGVLTLVAWLIRLEAKVLYLERDYARESLSNKETYDGIKSELREIKTSLNELQQGMARLQGRLGVEREE